MVQNSAYMCSLHQREGAAGQIIDDLAISLACLSEEERVILTHAYEDYLPSRSLEEGEGGVSFLCVSPLV